jgi:hypothetical protein
MNLSEFKGSAGVADPTFTTIVHPASKISDPGCFFGLDPNPGRL